MKDFIYLVQGKARSIPDNLHLRDRDRADAIFLTFDEPLDCAEFLPKSTWTQGRNRLLELALLRKPYSYYIFCDDDIVFQVGSWNSFENLLLKYSPAVAAPVMPRVYGSKKIPLVDCQGFVMSDEQLMAFHRNTLLDKILLPYQEKFDHMTSYAASEIQELLILNLYAGRAVQFNKVVIDNTVHAGTADTKLDFRTPLRDWLKTQFRRDIELKDVWRGYRDTFIYECFYTFLFYARHYFTDNNFPMTRGRRLKKLNESSIFVDRNQS